MAIRNSHRLVSAGPLDASNGFAEWFEDGNGLALELVTNADPLAPAIGEFQRPGDPTIFPDNFPEEAFYYMAEARLEVGGAGIVGRARVIMALEAAFGGDGTPEYGESMVAPAHLGVAFARFRVRIDDLSPGREYIVRHPYGETDPLASDDRGRIAYTCDLGLAEGNMQRVLVTGEIAPFMKWATGAPAGYIGDGVTERPVVGGPFRNHVEIEGPGIGLGSANAIGPDLVRTDLFTIQGRLRGTGTNSAPGGPIIPLLDITQAEFRLSRGEYRIRGQVAPVSTGGVSNMVTVEVDGNEIGSAFPDITGAWSVRVTLAGST
ncbi:MAG: hypothetical protein QM690_12630, partial [Sphingobium sp.]